jgi:Protein of unknown function (DUF2510)/HIRAN domain
MLPGVGFLDAFRRQPARHNSGANRSIAAPPESREAWYADPLGHHQHRYWDGMKWTEHVADDAKAAIDPLPEGYLQPANIRPDWIEHGLWREWDPPLNAIRGESRHQDVFLKHWRILEDEQHWEPVPVVLIREPQNPVDRFALRAEMRGEMVGYLAREVALEFSPQLDQAGCDRFSLPGVVCGGCTDAPSFGLHLWLNRRLSSAPAWRVPDDRRRPRAKQRSS